MSWPAVVAVGVVGLAVGTWLNLLTTRWIGWRLVLPQLLGYGAPYSVTRGVRARCRTCEKPLVLSWTLHLGRCFRCKDRLTRRYLAVELVTAGLFAWATARITEWDVLVPILVLFAFLVAVSTVDITAQRIPTRWIYATYPVLIVSMVVASVHQDVPKTLIGAAVGGAFYFTFLFLFHLLSPRRMGFGDVRLAGVMGLVLGWLGYGDFPILGPISMVIWAALIGSVFGTFVGFAVLVATRRSRYFPFGPSLAAGTAIVVLFADRFRP